jgi:hypothetical protein
MLRTPFDGFTRQHFDTQEFFSKGKAPVPAWNNRYGSEPILRVRYHSLNVL